MLAPEVLAASRNQELLGQESEQQEAGHPKVPVSYPSALRFGELFAPRGCRVTASPGGLSLVPSEALIEACLLVLLPPLGGHLLSTLLVGHRFGTTTPPSLLLRRVERSP